jgi:hypothetical protein
LVVRSRNDPVPVSMMEASKVSRPTIARRAARPQRSRSKVVSLPERRRDADLPPDSRPTPSVVVYDQLLSTTPRKGNAS